MPIPSSVIPAKTGIQITLKRLNSRVREKDVFEHTSIKLALMRLFLGAPLQNPSNS